MKWLIGCLLALVMVSAGFAGEDPYIAIVGNDAIVDLGGAANPFYFSPKHQQFLYDQVAFGVEECYEDYAPLTLPGGQIRYGGLGCESFRSNNLTNQPEICDTLGTFYSVGNFDTFGNNNAVVRAGNAGYFEWWIRLPKKPSGEINICLQCGVLKPDAFEFEEFNSVNVCAAETGERIGDGLCVREEVDPGFNPLDIRGLPTIRVQAHPGPFAPIDPLTGDTWKPFHLTAFRNPSGYNGNLGVANAKMTNGTDLQILDNSANTKVLLKSCMDKCIVAKLPVTGQRNATAAELENDLEMGDIIRVILTIPRYNTVDVYCHSQSARLAGIGEAP